MINKIRYCIILLLAAFLGSLVLSGTVAAQGGKHGYFLKAERLAKKQQYAAAATYYQKYLASERSVAAKADPFGASKKYRGGGNGQNVHQTAVYSIAECYRLMHDYQQAEPYYKEAAGFSEKLYPAAAFWYAVTLRANQKYKEAIDVLTAFRQRYTELDNIGVAADRELMNLEFIKAQLDNTSPEFIVTSMVSPTNTSAYAATVVSGDTMMFSAIKEIEVYEASAGEKKKGIIVPPRLVRLFETRYEEEAFLRASEWDSEAKAGYHDGLATFIDGKKMFFTRWTEVQGKTVAAIYTSEKRASGWTTPVIMGAPVNIAGANSTQPFVTKDGRYLLFSSDRQGGSGKYDIWYASLDNNFEAVKVDNLGNGINTAEDEFSPSYHAGAKTILFSSNGRTGMGGFDVYYSQGSIILSDWETPQNAGSPINSSKDDLYYLSTDDDNLWNTGFVSSDRDTSSCCLAMYHVKQENRQYIKGLVQDCNTQEVLQDVTLALTDNKTGKVVKTTATDENGQYTFEVSNTSRFTISAEKPDYSTASETYRMQINAWSNSLETDPLCLTRTANNKIDSLQQVLNRLSNSSSTLALFAFNKSSIGQPGEQLDSLISIMNEFPTLRIEIGGHTDSKGPEQYNILLSQKRVDACINYLVKKGINRDRFVGQAYGESQPLEPEMVNGRDNPAARKKNRRVEYKIIL